MCGIVGYVGAKSAAPILIDGLARLEYRGYDSAGVAVLGSTSLRVHRDTGRVRDLEATLPKRFAGKLGIGHTRWATHGAPTPENAHPHVSMDGRVAVVHNGIIDNAAALRAALQADGVTFSSETDTEVLAHLIARVLAKGADGISGTDGDSGADGARHRPSTLEDAVLTALDQVEGTYGIAVASADHPDRIVVARNGSPIILGIGEREMHVASDAAALVRYTRQVVHLDDGELATVRADGYQTFTRHARTTKTAITVDWTADDYQADGHEHFMHKEIVEQPEAVHRCLRGRLDERFATAHLGGLNMDPREAREFRRVKILGCGSAYYAGQLGAQFIEEVARIPADAEPASEFRYRNPVIEKDTLYVAVSQSGETFDTLVAVQELKRKGGRVVGLVNVVGSSIARECDGGIYLHAGPEVAVASTKALTNMGVAFALLGIHLGRIRDLSPADGARLIAGLQRLPEQIEAVLKDEERLASIARRLSAAESLFYIGRTRGYPVAREGAQKLKEISYRHAEAYQTSELKHGPLALISPDVPTVAIVPDDDLVERNTGALHEIAARSGPLYVVTHPGVELGDVSAEPITVPKNETELDPIVLTIPLQLLAYHASRELGHDVDKPRNLAKSVTVE
ncbi:glutamine--fructose-6-phosphate transaminase (isomerizing) [Phytoactinopolyspora halotolerans]|uniref:Glutamine--fructose-6-phosphate aminotransferase [isomerizing] n=1 Tax=Phytoactinopolyspora halotolerans TaxID=1981512 RepID=A0A6L9S9V3_9ACTN|nr:glutamine--fructose-6-phosphate transaminase (isomerizing) [Phytoactinopolyspora halotolerans]NEE01414.1 glutamine--fructose-6-phosphate transaminase (isomerizing) [Phytoactinopolyspora halotolerans]